jgi:ribonuclease HI
MTSLKRAASTAVDVGTPPRRKFNPPSQSAPAPSPSPPAPPIPSKIINLVNNPISHFEAAETLFLYTDGSCPVNRNVAFNTCAAGWGVVAVRLVDSVVAKLEEDNLSIDLPALEHFLNPKTASVVAELYGPVIVCGASGDSSKPLDDCGLGAIVGSNNTGELSAIGEALLYVRDHVTPTPKRLVLMFDSEYAARSVTGEYDGPKNKSLIVKIRQVLQSTIQKLAGDGGEELSSSDRVSFVHVRAHNNNFFNDRADYLAKRGAAGDVCSIGRYFSLAVKTEDSNSTTSTS